MVNNEEPQSSFMGLPATDQVAPELKELTLADAYRSVWQIYAQDRHAEQRESRRRFQCYVALAHAVSGHLPAASFVQETVGTEEATHDNRQFCPSPNR